MQILDDIKGHFNWVSAVTENMKDNDENELQTSNFEIRNRLKDNYKGVLIKRIHSCGEGKTLRTYAEFKHGIIKNSKLI